MDLDGTHPLYVRFTAQDTIMNAVLGRPRRLAISKLKLRRRFRMVEQKKGSTKWRLNRTAKVTRAPLPAKHGNQQSQYRFLDEASSGHRQVRWTVGSIEASRLANERARTKSTWRAMGRWIRERPQNAAVAELGFCCAGPWICIF